MSKVVYWYVSPDQEVYQDDVATVGVGLRKLGYEIYGTRDYWQEGVDGDFIVKQNDESLAYSADLVIISWTWLRSFSTKSSEFRITERGLPSFFSSPKVNPEQSRILIDLDDGYETNSFKSECSQLDYVLRCKYNKRCFHPENHIPWALGISNRMTESLPCQPVDFEMRSRTALVNFGASHPYAHATRELFTGRFHQEVSKYLKIDSSKDDLSQIPGDAWECLMWNQTQKRHCQKYYDKLSESQVVAAFCGDMIPPSPFRPDYLVGGNRALIKRRIFDLLGKVCRVPPRAIQWDSWRFWEALAAGCLVFNIDLEYYGVELPVMPVSGIHYVGLRLDNIEIAVKEVLSDPWTMARIAREGREWAIANYTPQNSALRLIETISRDRKLTQGVQ